MSFKQDRLSVSVMKHLSEIITYEVKNPEIGFVTITGVDVSPDGSYAKVYVTFLGTKDVSKNLKALERTKGFLRTKLSKRLGKRIVPELNFVLDKSYDEGNKIESILKNLGLEDDEDIEEDFDEDVYNKELDKYFNEDFDVEELDEYFNEDLDEDDFDEDDFEDEDFDDEEE